MTIEEMMQKLQTMLSEKRFGHSMAVMKAAVKLAKRYGASEEKAAIAGLIHDCAKGLSNEELLKQAKEFGIVIDNICINVPEILHAPVGAELAQREFDVSDNDILNSIKYHTTGSKEMMMLDKIIYIADYISEDRDFPGVEELRRASEIDLNKAVVMGMNTSIGYVISKNGLIHNDTIEARNSLILIHPELNNKD